MLRPQPRLVCTEAQQQPLYFVSWQPIRFFSGPQGSPPSKTLGGGKKDTNGGE